MAHRHGGEGQVETEERLEGGSYIPPGNSSGLQELGEQEGFTPRASGGITAVPTL